MRRLLPLLLLVAAGVALAAFYVPTDAATVNGTSISRDSLNSDLHAIAGSSSFQCYLQAQVAVASQGSSQLPLPVLGAGSAGEGNASAGTYNTAFVDYWLGQRVDNELISQLAARRHVTVTGQDLSPARSDLLSTISGTLAAAAGSGISTCNVNASQVLPSLPASFVNELVHAQAVQDAYEASLGGYGLGSGDLARYFAAHRSQFDQICLSDIALGTQAEALLVRAAIVGGASFSQEAMSQSLDTSSKSHGGALGCYAAATSPIVADVTSLGVGQVSQPISYQGAYVLLEVTGRRPATFTGAGGQVRTEVIGAGRLRAQRALRVALRASHISTDPRYGRWSPQLDGVLFPPVPPPGTVLSLSANSPGSP